MQQEIFTFEHLPIKWSNFVDDEIDAISCSIVYELSNDRVLIQRIVYNVLDYLGDIGGLFGIFSGFASVFSLIMNFNGVYHLLTSSLFRVETLAKKSKHQEAP